VCAHAAGLFLLPASMLVSAQPSNVASASPADECLPLFEQGMGGDIEVAVRNLGVDVNHGVSLMMLPGFAAPGYSISLAKAENGTWSLIYVINSFPPGRRYRAAVPFLSASDAQRIENIWTRAIAEAKPKSTPSAEQLGCLHLDGMSYVFSANGRQANNFMGGTAIARGLVEISNTLRLIAMDTRNMGHPLVSDLDDLSNQLARIEGELNIHAN
jgi:hypothetical protein